MKSFAARVIEQGVASAATLDEVLDEQLLLGGDLCTPLLERGIEEAKLIELLAAHFELEPGPAGRLPPAGSELSEAVPAHVAASWRVYPLGRARRHVRVAVSQPLDRQTAERLGERLGGLEPKPVLVTELRLAEALWRYSGVALGERERALIGSLDGEVIERSPPVVRSTAYRRMSERPSGVVPSHRQRRRLEHTPEPITLPDPHVPDDGAPETAPGPPVRVQPPVEASLPRPFAGSTAESEPPPATDPWNDQDAGGGRKRRTTDPWRDGDEVLEQPISLRHKLQTELGERSWNVPAPTFRHRGPLPFEQARAAVMEARDVDTVLQVLLRYARQYFERAMLLAVQGDVAECRGAYGMKPSQATLRVTLSGPGLLRRAVRGGEPVVAPFGAEGVDALLAQQLGVGERAVAFVPVQIRGRVVALVYGDDLESGVDGSAVRDVWAFAEVAAVVIAALIVKKKQS